MSKRGHIVDAYNAKTVEQNYMKDKGMKKKRTTPPMKREEKRKRVSCPYLSNNPKRICTEMVKKGLDGKVSSFDIKHFCRGTPFHCYYFRFRSSKK